MTQSENQKAEYSDETMKTMLEAAALKKRLQRLTNEYTIAKVLLAAHMQEENPKFAERNPISQLSIVESVLDGVMDIVKEKFEAEQKAERERGADA